MPWWAIVAAIVAGASLTGLLLRLPGIRTLIRGIDRARAGQGDPAEAAARITETRRQPRG